MNPTRVIVASTGTRGDILPFLSLAQALAREGHSVVFLAPAFHAPMVQAAGIEFQPFGTVAEFQQVLDNPQLWDDRKGFGVVWGGLVPHLGVLRDLVLQQPAGAPLALLCHPILFPLADIARASRAGVRVVSGYLAPSNLCSSHDLLTVGAQRVPRWWPLWLRRFIWSLAFKVWIDPDILPSLNAFRQTQGLPPVAGFRQHLHDGPDASVGLFPPWFASRQADWPSPFFEGDFPFAEPAAAAALPPALDRFLRDGPPPIAFTPGTGHRHAAAYFSTAVHALERLGRRGLLVTPFADQLPRSLPPQVMWIDQAPFDVLLPRVAALVHHGGIGTSAQAARCGVAQLIVPYAFDQFDNGLRLKRLGVAEVLPAARFTARRAHARLQALLSSDAVARACAELAARPAQPAALVDQVARALGPAGAAAPEPALREAAVAMR